MASVPDLLRRARSAVGQATIYHLGSGGIDPLADTPGNHQKECACSGFVCWALGIRRMTTHPLYPRDQHGHEWINTDSMVMDIGRPSGFFEP